MDSRPLPQAPSLEFRFVFFGASCVVFVSNSVDAIAPFSPPTTRTRSTPICVAAKPHLAVRIVGPGLKCIVMMFKT